MTRPVLHRSARALAVTAALALTLTACGNSGDDPTVAASASPTAAATTAPACPISATQVPAPAGGSTDLKTKPKVTKGTPPGPTEITYFDIVTGTGPEVMVGSTAKLKYVGAIYDTGKEFDSSWSRGADETFDIKACYQGAIDGFSVGPIGMKVGGRRQINIPAKFGYADKGSPPKIAPDQDLIFVVDLVAVS